MEFMDSEQVIIEVRKYPCLYDINDEFYKDKNVKKEAWKCVANNVSGGTLQTMSLECQNEYEKDLHKKWRSLRDAFTRACRTTHLEPRRISGKPKKPYVYYKQMSFLLPNIQLKPAFIQMPEPIHIKEEQAILGIESEPEFTEEIIPEYNEIVKEEVDEFSDTHLEKKRRLESIEEDERKTFENLSNTTTDKIEDDPDKMFLLSLLPNFKKIKSSDKLDIQIKIMQMLKNRLDSY